MTGAQRGLFGLLPGVLIFAIAGCGGGETLVTVTGKVVDGGKPISFEGADQEAIEEMGAAPIEVELWPVDGAGNVDKQRKPYGASVELDGSFKIAGEEGDGFPAGRYRVALRYTAGEDMGMDEAPEGEAPTPWGDKFTAEKSPWTYDFTSDQQITLDVATAGGAETPESESETP